MLYKISSIEGKTLYKNHLFNMIRTYLNRLHEFTNNPRMTITVTTFGGNLRMIFLFTKAALGVICNHIDVDAALKEELV